MKLFVVAALVLVADAFSFTEEWQQFKTDHGKSYKSLKEEKHRYSIFQRNLQLIQGHNEKYDKGEVTYAMKITQFADMTQKEFLKLLKLRRNTIRSTGRERFVPSGGKIPKSKDWRKKGAVTRVKNQGSNCGSCWAFSATGAIEGQLFRKNHTLISLSEQNLMDCDNLQRGCDGGDMEFAFDYVRDHGITTEHAYPYEAEKKRCRVKRHRTIRIKDYVEIEHDEKHITEALATVGPITVGINSWPSMYLYSHGIVDGRSGCSQTEDTFDQGALLVGYGEEAGVPYYIVKNSWGTKWGEKGYFRLRRNENACGVKWYCSYPKM